MRALSLLVLLSSVVLAQGGQVAPPNGGCSTSSAICNLVRLRTSDGTAALPAWSFRGDPNTGIYRVGADQLGITTAGVRSFNFSATAGLLEGISASPVLKLDDLVGAQISYGSGSFVAAAAASVNIAATNTTTITAPFVNVAATNGLNVATAATPLKFNGVTAIATTTPTIFAGFGTSPSISGKAYAFRVVVGTGGTANDGSVNLGTTPTTGWVCTCTNMTAGGGGTPRQCLQSSFGASAQVDFMSRNYAGSAVAFVASDILLFSCLAF